MLKKILLLSILGIAVGTTASFAQTATATDRTQAPTKVWFGDAALQSTIPAEFYDYKKNTGSPKETAQDLGFKLGVGREHYYTPNWYVNGELFYDYFGSFSVKGNAGDSFTYTKGGTTTKKTYTFTSSKTVKETMAAAGVLFQGGYHFNNDMKGYASLSVGQLMLSGDLEHKNGVLFISPGLGIGYQLGDFVPYAELGGQPVAVLSAGTHYNF